jgi:hypothetical protein
MTGRAAANRNARNNPAPADPGRIAELFGLGYQGSFGRQSR